MNFKEQLIIETMRRKAIEMYHIYHEINTQLENQQLNMMQIIIFDENLTKLGSNITSALLSQRDFYIQLASEFIDLPKMQQSGSQQLQLLSNIK